MRPFLHPFLLLIAMITPFALTAQYEKGEIVFTGGEVRVGYLQHDSDVELSRRVYYKPELSTAEGRAYGPNEVQTFAFDEGPSFETVPANYRDGEILIQQKAFAKVIARGTVDLLLLQSGIQEDVFILFARKQGRLYQLNEVKDQEITYRLSNGNHYQGLLNALTYDCRSRVADPRQIRFSRRAITELIDQYNTCRDGDYQPMDKAYEVAKQRRIYAEAFGGTIVGRRVIGTLLGGDRMVQREVFASVGLSLQMEVFKPSLSKRLLIHTGLEAYKWVTVQDKGFILPPFLSMALSMAAHYELHQGRRWQLYSRLGGTFTFDIGRDVIPRPGMVFGFGLYGPGDGRLGLQVATLSLFGGEGTTAWRIGYAIPLTTLDR